MKLHSKLIISLTIVGYGYRRHCLVYGNRGRWAYRIQIPLSYSIPRHRLFQQLFHGVWEKAVWRLCADDVFVGVSGLVMSETPTNKLMFHKLVGEFQLDNGRSHSKRLGRWYSPVAASFALVSPGFGSSFLVSEAKVVVVNVRRAPNPGTPRPSLN